MSVNTVTMCVKLTGIFDNVFACPYIRSEE